MKVGREDNQFYLKKIDHNLMDEQEQTLNKWKKPYKKLITQVYYIRK